MFKRIILAVSILVGVSFVAVPLGVGLFNGGMVWAQEKKCEKCGHEKCPGECKNCPDCKAKPQKCDKCGHIGCSGDCNKCRQCQREKSGY